MQTIPQNGYTKDEILSELQFSRGTRRITFRYELLDLLNAKIQDLDNVLDCQVDADFTADVKRTASFTLQDDGSIDYTNNRIKPWARIIMPSRIEDYDAYIGTTVNGITVGRYDLDETFASGGALNQGLAGTGFNGSIGTGVSLNAAGIVEGSSFLFVAGTGVPANRLTITNGTKFLYNPTGASGFTVGNEFSTTFWFKHDNFVEHSSYTLFQSSDDNFNVRLLQGSITVKMRSSNGVTIQCSAPNPFGNNLKMISVSRKIGSTFSIYANGEKQVTTATVDDVNGSPGATGDLWIGSIDGTMDSILFYNRQLSDQQMLDIYRSGANTGPWGNTNYAEWPQGVFILNSPTRSEDANKVITRKIDGYDLNQAYVDDVISSRYALLAGTTYMNGILGMVLNYVPKNLGIQDPTYWEHLNGIVSFAPGSTVLTLTGPTTTAAPFTNYSTKNIFSLANTDLRTNMTLPTSGNGTRQINMEIGSSGGNRVIFIIFWQSSAHSYQLEASVTYAGLGTTVLAFGLNYNAVTMAYMRIWENNGIIFFQYSSDNASWVTYAQTASWSYLDQCSYGPFIAVGAIEPAWSVTYNLISLLASPVIPVNASPSTAFPSVAKDYDPGTTKLAIINDLLSTIAYNPLYFDENGVPQIQPWVDPATRAPEYVYAEDQDSVTLPAKDDTFDLWGVPNVFVLVASNPDATLYTATYRNDNPLSPTSTVSRGRDIVHYELEQDVSNLLDLQTKAKALATAASQVYNEIDFTTAIMPFHSTNDVYGIDFEELGAIDKYNEIGWSFEFKDGATMSHKARKQVDI